jgi:hypothetical protein
MNNQSDEQLKIIDLIRSALANPRDLHCIDQIVKHQTAVVLFLIEKMDILSKRERRQVYFLLGMWCPAHALKIFAARFPVENDRGCLVSIEAIAPSCIGAISDFKEAFRASSGNITREKAAIGSRIIQRAAKLRLE